MVKFLAFGCVHHPIASVSALAWLHDQIEEFRPDVLVCLGDVYDGEGWSRWDNENAWTVVDEYEGWRDHLKILNDFTFLQKKVWLYGNHESNIEQPGRLKKSQRDIIHWKDWSPEGVGGIREQVKDWHIIPGYNSRQKWCLGPITFVHGTKTNIYAARDEARMHGTYHGLTVGAHTHRPVSVSRDVNAGGIPGDLWYANTGCLMDWDAAHYIQRSNFQGWGHGIVCGEVHSSNATLMHEGRKAFMSKIWDAETRILRLARDCR